MLKRNASGCISRGESRVRRLARHRLAGPRHTGTVFIARDPKQAAAQTRVFEEPGCVRVHAPAVRSRGHLDRRAARAAFKTTLFQAFPVRERLRDVVRTKPVTLV